MMRTAFFILLLSASASIRAQTNDYYQQARQLAFDKKDYPAARALCAKAVQQDGALTDARILMSRLFAWEQQYDSARIILKEVLKKFPQHEDALMAITDVAFWDKQYKEALAYCETALQQYPTSAEWRQRTTKIKAAMEDGTRCNRVGTSYEYYYFDKQFPQPWHIASVEYSRLSKAGNVTGRVSYGNRYGLHAWQGEAEAYPRLSKQFYSYVNIGFSGNGNYVFPKFRSGVSLFAGLPAKWELEGGVRYLQFDEPVWIYTGSLGKYIGKYWFNLRSFIAPGNERLSQSYFLTGRYYYAKAGDYITLTFGSGVSPDENRNIQIAAADKLSSYRIGAGIHHSFGANIIFSNMAWSRDEYRPKIYGNQLNIGIGLQRKF